MLGNDKSFNDRLSWALVLPLSALGGFAASLALLALGLVVEGDAVGSAAYWIDPLRAAAFVFAACRLGASIAPARKLLAALALGALYVAAAAFWMKPARAPVAGALIGAAAGCWAARRLADDEAGPAKDSSKEPAA